MNVGAGEDGNYSRRVNSRRGVDAFDISDDNDSDGKYTGPQLLEECEYRDGSYWLTPEMYIDHEDFLDLENYWKDLYQDYGII